MPIDPKELVYYALSQDISSCSEIELRIVINRAYYGAMLAARDRAKITNQSGSIHREVISFYDSRHKPTSNRLDDLKRERELADYNTNKNIVERDAQNSCRKAEKILYSLANDL